MADKEQGLDSLNVRCKQYYEAGVRFAKWRSPLVIGADGTISDLAIRANMEDLARLPAPRPHLSRSNPSALRSLPAPFSTLYILLHAGVQCPTSCMQRARVASHGT